MHEHRPVTVQFHKYDGALHWRHDTVRLGEDEHGVWVGAKAGAAMQRGHEPARSVPCAYVQLLPHVGNWSAIFNEPMPNGKYRVYIDIAHDLRWTGRDRVEMVDMDLDVVRYWGDDHATVIDRDEFELHQARYAYPQALIDDVEATTADVVRMIDAGEEPFASVGERWLASFGD